MVNKQLQYTYCPISHEVKAIKLGQLIEYNKKNCLRPESASLNLPRTP